MKNPEVYKQQALYWQNYRIIDRTVTACVHLEDKDDRHSGYFPWNQGKFICKGEGKWSCSGLRSYWSYGSEVTE